MLRDFLDYLTIEKGLSRNTDEAYRGDLIKFFSFLEKENVRLKKLVADLSLDNSILKEAAEGNF